MKNWHQFLEAQAPLNPPVTSIYAKDSPDPANPGKPIVWECRITMSNGEEFYQGEGHTPEEAARHGIDAIREYPEDVIGFSVYDKSKL